mgnify:CR=1 FL=1
MKKPNFLIVGAAKSGTTSMCYYLNQHKDIFIPDFKEPQFFVFEKIKNRLHKYVDNIEDYVKLFKNRDEKIIGEGSVFYLFFYKQAIKNIKKYCDKDIKILILLRNPVTRCLSAYNHVSRNNLMEKMSFSAALEKEEIRFKEDKNITPMILYKNMGLYYNQVKAYLDNFKHVKIVIYDDFNNNSQKVYNDVLSFLDVDQEYKINFNNRFNVGGWQWKNNFLKSVFLKQNFFKKAITLCFSKSFKNKVKTKSMNLAVNKQHVDSDIKSYLCGYYKKDVEKLSDLLNVDLSFWLK